MPPPGTLRAGRIRQGDRPLHAGFFGFVDAMFPGAGAAAWPRWRDRGGWTDRYEVFTLSDESGLVASIGRSRLTLMLGGRAHPGFQLGAVATHPAWRGRGLARRLMRRVLAECDTPEQPVLLFANPSVLDFYPRFGFRALKLRRSRAVAPASPAAPAPMLDPARAADRARLAGLCAGALPHAGPLAPVDYGWLALWHLNSGHPRAHLLEAPEVPAEAPGALVVSSLRDDWLVLHDIFAPTRFDLAPLIPRLIDRPVRGVEFSFDPAGWWPGATADLPAPPGATLFLRGLPALGGPVRFPDLAHT